MPGIPSAVELPDPDHVRILMGTCNGAQWLRAQLDSLLAQSHTDWSLWVSDDGSQDATRAILTDFARANPGRLALVRDGPGQGSAANFLQLLCDPDLPTGHVALSDQDDVWHKHKLEWALERLRIAGPAPAAWAARYRFTDAALNEMGVSARWLRGPSFGNAMLQNILSGHSLTLNPAALVLVRRAGPVAVPHHDWWIYLLLTACGAEVICDDRIVLDYRQHDRNAMGARRTLRVRAARGAALLSGQMQAWISANMHALQKAAERGVNLTPPVTGFLRDWPTARLAQRLHLMRRFALHRQSRVETGALYLAAALGRL